MSAQHFIQDTRGPRAALLAAAFLLLLPGLSPARKRAPASTGYRMPPKAIAELVDAPPTPDVSVGPRAEWMLVMARPSLPPLSELAEPELPLAGSRINPRTFGASRTSHYTRLTLKRIADGSERPVTGLPSGARIGGVDWSPDGERIAFPVTRDTGIDLWVAEVRTGQARPIPRLRLNATYGRSFSWLPDSRSLICKAVPETRGPAPSAPAVPEGPVIQESAGRKAAARTYQDLLQNAHDEALFEYYLTSRVMRVTLDGKSAPLGPAGLIRRAEPAPGGKYLLVETIHRPFSFLVPASRFPLRVEVWDMEGRVVRQVADLPLAEEVPIAFDAVPPGPRSFAWRADAPATLTWVEAGDGGDPRNKAEVRDRVFALAAPFRGEPEVLASLGMRLSGITWSEEGVALVSESWRQTRRTRTWVLPPGAPGSRPHLLFDRSAEDRYRDPGRPMLRENAAGRAVLHTAEGGKSFFLAGQGASPEGSRPFVDRIEWATGKTRRLWHSAPPHYESAVRLLDTGGRRLLTRRESKTDPPNYYLRDLGDGQPRQLTAFPHPAPQLAGVRKELLRYDRADGVKLTATLYLPSGRSPGDGPLPMLMWAYPREFLSADAASQVTDSPHRFVGISPTSPLLLLAHGYAVLENPTMPIVGAVGREPNDTYVEQLVASARAAVEEVARRGVADRDRIAIGGHSYGAFMTANLLAHSDLFRAGIARSGAYNRTLTPFGFQAEQRTLWEAPEIYIKMSPFMQAAKIDEPLLLIHGEADDNPGTFPIQSERFYAALTGHGATARLVMLPHESHGYRARESVMHVLWETATWLDKYVKNAPPRAKGATEAASSAGGK